jgi:hypothetical protein
LAIQVLLLPRSANLTIAGEDFMPRIQLQTGDITHQPFKLREFALEARRPLSQILLAFDGREACIQASQWPSLLEQVKLRSLSRWKHPRMPLPMGQAEMQELLSAVDNTPAYQLFLAGFDLAETLALVSELPERVVLRRAIVLEERVPSTIGPGGLFVVPVSLLEETVEAESINELVRNNKLCRLHVEAGETVEKYYIPYATPVGFPASASIRAKQLWERLRDYFYSFR